MRETTVGGRRVPCEIKRRITKRIVQPVSSNTCPQLKLESLNDASVLKYPTN